MNKNRIKTVNSVTLFGVGVGRQLVPKLGPCSPAQLSPWHNDVRAVEASACKSLVARTEVVWGAAVPGYSGQEALKTQGGIEHWGRGARIPACRGRHGHTPGSAARRGGSCANPARTSRKAQTRRAKAQEEGSHDDHEHHDQDSYPNRFLHHASPAGGLLTP